MKSLTAYPNLNSLHFEQFTVTEMIDARLPVRIRPAGVKDAPVIFAMMKSFAIEIGYPDSVSIPLERLESVISQRDGIEFVVILTRSECLGFSSFMERSISFRSEKAIYVEDTYIEPNYRAFGLARRLLGYIADVALSRNILRLEWLALEGSGIALTESVAAEKVNNLTPYRLSQEQMRSLVHKLVDE